MRKRDLLGGGIYKVDSREEQQSLLATRAPAALWSSSAAARQGSARSRVWRWGRWSRRPSCVTPPCTPQWKTDHHEIQNNPLRMIYRAQQKK